MMQLSVFAFSQSVTGTIISTDTIIISTRVGAVIDVWEKQKYHIFPNYTSNQFVQAVLFRLADSNIIVKVLFKNGEVEERTMSANYFFITKCTINGDCPTTIYTSTLPSQHQKSNFKKNSLVDVTTNLIGPFSVYIEPQINKRMGLHFGAGINSFRPFDIFSKPPRYNTFQLLCDFRYYPDAEADRNRCSGFFAGTYLKYIHLATESSYKSNAKHLTDEYLKAGATIGYKFIAGRNNGTVVSFYGGYGYAISGKKNIEMNWSRERDIRLGMAIGFRN